MPSWSAEQFQPFIPKEISSNVNTFIPPIFFLYHWQIQGWGGGGGGGEAACVALSKWVNDPIIVIFNAIYKSCIPAPPSPTRSDDNDLFLLFVCQLKMIAPPSTKSWICPSMISVTLRSQLTVDNSLLWQHLV